MEGYIIYAEGEFYNIGGATRYKLTKLSDVDDSVDTLWNPNANHTVNVVVKNGGDIYYWRKLYNAWRSNRTCYGYLNNIDGAVDSLWHPFPNDGVYKISVNQKNVYVDGLFTTINNCLQDYLVLF